MSIYAEIDPIIEKWVQTLGSQLFTEWAGKPARFFYTPGAPPFECFQISVDPPKKGRTAVYARAVDTNDDTENELEESWAGSTTDLDRLLESAVREIDKWKIRERRKPDLPSPW